MSNLINQPPATAVDHKGGSISQGWAQFFSQVSTLLIALTLSGTTAQRPSSFLWMGRPYFDSTLGKPIWYTTGGVWVDATGAPA